MFTERIKPRFLETDALGHINNNTYGVWFEAARDEMRYFVSLCQQQISKSGI